MLFSAGMGIGLMFWGVAEPILHFSSPPIGEPYTVESAKEAMKITFFHWGIHAWSIYGMLAVTLAYFHYRKDLPLLPRSIFHPLLGDKVHGCLADMIDTFAVLGTMFGVATSLGLGVTQLNAGLSYLFEIPQNILIQIILITGITFLATLSVVLGLDKGIKTLSNINVILATILMTLILFLGNSVGILQAFVQNTGSYLSDLIYKTFNLYAYEHKESWIGGWTLLYWGWWISWSPFVGMFIARISKGRSIREFMIGVLFVPTLFTFLWMTVFGNSAIHLILTENALSLTQAVAQDVSIMLFKFLEYFPFTSFLSIVSLILIVTFFVSSSDSGSLVIDTLATKGNDNPPVWQKIFWSVTEGIVASALLVAGGLNALQAMTVLSAFPILVTILLGAYVLVKSLREDRLLQTSVNHHSTVIQYSKASTSWKERLNALVSHPQDAEVLTFLKEVAIPALQELRTEMCKNGLNASLEEASKNRIKLLVQNDDADDFHYEIRLQSFEMPEHAVADNQKFCRADVFLSNGGQDYDVFGYTQHQIIADALTQYEKHVHFLHRATLDSTGGLNI